MADEKRKHMTHRLASNVIVQQAVLREQLAKSDVQIAWMEQWVAKTVRDLAQKVKQAMKDDKEAWILAQADEIQNDVERQLAIERQNILAQEDIIATETQALTAARLNLQRQLTTDSQKLMHQLKLRID